MRGDQVQRGMRIDYRGAPADVVLAWAPGGGDTPPQGITDPCGFEIEWIDTHGEQQRTRVVWPDFSAPEQSALDAMGPEARAAAVADRLAADLASRTVELWGA